MPWALRIGKGFLREARLMGRGTGLTELEGPLTVSGPCSATNPTSKY